MTVAIKPEWQKFIDDQVKAGSFRSAEEVLEAGLARLMLDPAPDVLDEQDITNIRASMEEADRGELIDAEIVHADIRKKYLAR